MLLPWELLILLSLKECLAGETPSRAAFVRQTPDMHPAPNREGSPRSHAGLSPLKQSHRLGRPFVIQMGKIWEYFIQKMGETWLNLEILLQF